jgi:hypothetical protein
MSNLRKRLLGVAAFAALLPADAAFAAHTAFISAAGSDSGSCSSPVAPCRTLAYAYAQGTSPITLVVLDQVAGGPVTITGTTLITGASSASGLAVAGTDMFTIAAGPNDTVDFANLTLVSLPGSSTTNNAVNIQSAGTVTLNHVNVSYFGNAAVNINTTTSTRVTLENTFLEANGNGVLVTGLNGGSGHLKLFDSLVLSNIATGVTVNGTGNDALLANDKILGSPNGLSLLNGGMAKSYGNNVLTSGSAPTSTVPLM